MNSNKQSSKKYQYDVEDLVCFSHLRWDFVFQRPQHLMSRFVNSFRVFFIEEPVYHNAPCTLKIKLVEEKIWVVTPFLDQAENDGIRFVKRQKILIDQLFEDRNIKKFISWYYTPMALKFSNHLLSQLVIYDCMDELSAFKFAPAEMKIMETELIKKAHLVFTGGHSLYEAKKKAHHNIFPFPSSIDKQHFCSARNELKSPEDQKSIPPVRFGFFGVIDERFDINLIRELADKRPDWQIILLGPIVKIHPDELPKGDNIHYLGSKSYKELPAYLSGWQFTMIPFAKNESTKYISPTKTPEYLAAGKPVISTSIMDVVTPYGDKNLVYIADSADEFITAAECEMAKSAEERRLWLHGVDHFLGNISWDITSQNMMKKIEDCLLQKNALSVAGLKSVA